MSGEAITIKGTSDGLTITLGPGSLDVVLAELDALLSSRATFFVDSTGLTVTCPAESQSMPAGTYHLHVANFQGVGAYWMDSGVRGEFTVTGTPPPKIDELSPFRSPAADGVSTTISGTGRPVRSR